MVFIRRLKKHMAVVGAKTGFLLISLATLLGLMSVQVLGAAQGYITEDPDLKVGMTVALSDKSTSEKPVVERASVETADKIIGVTALQSDNVVTIASGESEVYVQTSGIVDGFVTDLNGTISKGNLLAISPLKGVLMRANSNSVGIVGIALEDFPTENLQSQTVTTPTGEDQASVTKIQLSLDNKAIQSGHLAEDSSLKRLGKSIIGKEVQELQVIISLLIFTIMIIAEGSIIYGAVSSAIVALGRNPLARRFIGQELFRMIGIAIFVLIVGLAAIYAVLSV